MNLIRFALVLALSGTALAQPEQIPAEDSMPSVEPALVGREWLTPEEPIVPRYRFEVGQKLVYGARSVMEHTHGRELETRTLTLWVTDVDEEDGWRLVIHTRSETRSLDTGGETVRDRTSEHIEYCDFPADGRFEDNPSLDARASVRFLPVLPSDTVEAAQGWEDSDPSGWEARGFRVLGIDPLDEYLLAMEQDKRGLRSKVYEVDYRAVTLFDTALGLPVYKEIDARNGYGRQGSTRMVFELDEVSYLDAFELDSFANQAKSWFSGYALWDMLTDEARVDLACADSLNREADSALARALDELTFEELRGPATRELERFRGYLSFMNQGGPESEPAGLEGLEAPGWELKGLDGKKYRLEDYDRTVVVLDFWYRGCPWCIRAMPQLKELREEFGDKSLTLFGINIDEDTSDARLVADLVKLNYPTLISEQTHKAYRVQGYPTLFVIAPGGRVYDIHRGYADDLGDNLRRQIDELLEVED